MKTIIFFREGLSGHYLKLLLNDAPDPVQFRIDPWYPEIYALPFTKKKEDCVCSHLSNIDVDKVIKNFDLVLTIQPYQKIYHGIYNVFYKKYLIENPDQKESFAKWTENLLTWYDRTYYNIKEYYHLFRQDLNDNTFDNIINFDYILDIDYIEEIIKKYYNKSLTKNMIRIITDYKKLQLNLDLSGDDKNMKDIVSRIPDHYFINSPWFASYCLFKYETNNNLTESMRKWSINSINVPIDQKFLISVADQYQS